MYDTFTQHPSRTPVSAPEVRFMRQRLEGEPVQTREVHDAIQALARLQCQMEKARRRAKAVAGGR